MQSWCWMVCLQQGHSRGGDWSSRYRLMWDCSNPWQQVKQTLKCLQGRKMISRKASQQRLHFWLSSMEESLARRGDTLGWELRRFCQRWVSSRSSWALLREVRCSQASPKERAAARQTNPRCFMTRVPRAWLIYARLLAMYWVFWTVRVWVRKSKVTSPKNVRYEWLLIARLCSRRKQFVFRPRGLQARAVCSMLPRKLIWPIGFDSGLYLAEQSCSVSCTYFLRMAGCRLFRPQSPL